MEYILHETYKKKFSALDIQKALTAKDQPFSITNTSFTKK